MDNITHSLVGVALADLSMRSRAPRLQRPLVVGAAVIAVNLPDVDLVYSSITPAPIGYLLHHRGHTHTVVGLLVLTILMVLAYRLLPPVRKLPVGERWRLWTLIAVGLASHLLLDALNSYGVHPFHPFDSSWYYGDAVFVFEPCIWVLLGAAAAWNARSRPGWLAATLPVIILLLTIAFMGVVSAEGVAALAIAGLAFTWIAGRVSSRMRAGLALTATTLIIFGMLAVSREAHAAATRVLRLESRGGRLVDVIMTPNPSSPLCWSVIGVEVDERSDMYWLRRGTLSLAPGWKSPTSCASHQLFGGGVRARVIGRGQLALTEELEQPLRPLRDLARNDCWTRAWLRFARAPVIAGREMFDLRFADRRNQNFTRMPLVRSPGDPRCPAFVPHWAMPRADLLE